MKPNFAEEIQSIGLMSPADIAATATSSAYINMAQVGSGQVEFDVFFGNVSSTDSTGEVTVTVDSSTGGITSDTNTAIAFKYRLSGAVGTDTMGTITDATSAGVSTLASALDNKRLMIYVDPAVVQDHSVRVTITPGGDSIVTLCSVTGRFIPRYAQNTLIDAVST